MTAVSFELWEKASARVDMFARVGYNENESKGCDPECDVEEVDTETMYNAFATVYGYDDVILSSRQCSRSMMCSDTVAALSGKVGKAE